MAPGVLRRGVLGALGASLIALAIATPASAQTQTFFNDDVLFPTGGAGNVGPANEYPSRITVSGVPGTIAKARVEIIGLDSVVPDNIDIVLVGPNGAKVLLMSDACGQGINPGMGQFQIRAANYIFDDDATAFLSQPGPCQGFDTLEFRPTNFLGNDGSDLLTPDGGPAPPYGSSLGAFDGISPNGNWDLFVRDDDEAVFGFVISGWAMRLDVAPPSNKFSVGEVAGKAVTVDVASAGALSVVDGGGKRLKESSASGGPGPVTVPLKLEKKGKQKLRRKGKVRVNAAITFTPDGGSPASTTAKLTIEK